MHGVTRRIDASSLEPNYPLTEADGQLGRARRKLHRSAYEPGSAYELAMTSSKSLNLARSEASPSAASSALDRVKWDIRTLSGISSRGDVRGKDSIQGALANARSIASGGGPVDFVHKIRRGGLRESWYTAETKIQQRSRPLRDSYSMRWSETAHETLARHERERIAARERTLVKTARSTKIRVPETELEKMKRSFYALAGYDVESAKVLAAKAGGSIAGAAPLRRRDFTAETVASALGWTGPHASAAATAAAKVLGTQEDRRTRALSAAMLFGGAKAGAVSRPWAPPPVAPHIPVSAPETDGQVNAEPSSEGAAQVENLSPQELVVPDAELQVPKWVNDFAEASAVEEQLRQPPLPWRSETFRRNPAWWYLLLGLDFACLFWAAWNVSIYFRNSAPSSFEEGIAATLGLLQLMALMFEQAER